MPLLKRLGEASFVLSPGIEALLSNAYHNISKKAIETAYQDSEEAEWGYKLFFATIQPQSAQRGTYLEYQYKFRKRM